MHAPNRLVPVTIITGFLGSGKTTLLNHILENTQGLKFAIIENEFGAVSVDDALIKHRCESLAEEPIEMLNGCICCTVRHDLVTAVKKIFARPGAAKLDGIIIETTGLADPAPVAQTFFVDPTISDLCTLDAIVTVVDGKHVVQQLHAKCPDGAVNECAKQITFADRIILNKMDLVTDEDEEELVARLRAMNPVADIIPTTNSVVDPSHILDIGGFSLTRATELHPEFLNPAAHYAHDATIKSLSIVSLDPINIHRLERWIQNLVGTQGDNLLRYKGVLNVKGMEQPHVLQGVQTLFSSTMTTPWRKAESRVNRLVFIGRNLDIEALQLSFAECRAETTLRFRVGATVFANVGNLAQGTVLKHWDEGHSYRIRLADGAEVWAPIDDDEFIRKAPRRLRKQRGPLATQPNQGIEHLNNCDGTTSLEFA